MNVYLVQHIQGESVIDYGTYASLVGIYSTPKNARTARANYAKRELGQVGMTYVQYMALCKNTKRVWEAEDSLSQSITIDKIVVDEREL